MSDEYGARAECERLMEDISRGLALIQARANIAQEVKVRSERLKQIARYRNAGRYLADAGIDCVLRRRRARRRSRSAAARRACRTCSPKTPGTCSGVLLR